MENTTSTAIPRARRDELFLQQQLGIGISVGILSAVVIGVTYATVLDPSSLQANNFTMLIVIGVVVMLNVFLMIWIIGLGVLERRLDGASGLIPVVFSFLGSVSLELYFGDVSVNLIAVQTSAAVFSGIALGNGVTYGYFNMRRNNRK